MPRDLLDTITMAGDYPYTWTGLPLLARYQLSGWFSHRVVSDKRRDKIGKAFPFSDTTNPSNISSLQLSVDEMLPSKIKGMRKSPVWEGGGHENGHRDGIRKSDRCFLQAHRSAVRPATFSSTLGK